MSLMQVFDSQVTKEQIEKLWKEALNKPKEQQTELNCFLEVQNDPNE